MTFFNTIKETGETLRESILKAKSQEERILLIFKDRAKNRVYRLTPFQVQNIYNNFFRATPITSIRRAMTNLTTKGLLVKTDEMSYGEYGKKNFTWTLPKEGTQTELF